MFYTPHIWVFFFTFPKGGATNLEWGIANNHFYTGRQRDGTAGNEME